MKHILIITGVFMALYSIIMLFDFVVFSLKSAPKSSVFNRRSWYIAFGFSVGLISAAVNYFYF